MKLAQKCIITHIAIVIIYVIYHIPDWFDFGCILQDRPEILVVIVWIPSDVNRSDRLLLKLRLYHWIQKTTLLIFMGLA